MTAFDRTYQYIEIFLRNPESEWDAFWEDASLIWAGWRAYDEDIARTVSTLLPEDARFDVETRDSVLPRGQDIRMFG